MFDDCKKLYEEIMAPDNTTDRWFELVLKTDDDEFIFQNVENRLAQNPGDKNLWMLYFDFLLKKKSIVSFVFLFLACHRTQFCDSSKPNF